MKKKKLIKLLNQQKSIHSKVFDYLIDRLIELDLLEYLEIKTTSKSIEEDTELAVNNIINAIELYKNGRK